MYHPKSWKLPRFYNIYVGLTLKSCVLNNTWGNGWMFFCIRQKTHCHSHLTSHCLVDFLDVSRLNSPTADGETKRRRCFWDPSELNINTQGGWIGSQSKPGRKSCGNKNPSDDSTILVGSLGILAMACSKPHIAG